MTRDNKERLEFFARQHGIEVHRLALNMDQVEQYQPPPNFAKQTDSRFDGYKKLYGESSWELDALRQSVIGQIITAKLDSLIDQDKWAESMAREKQLRIDTRVAELASRWDEVHKLLMDDGLPMDRLDEYEQWSPAYPFGMARTLNGAMAVVFQHDAENNRYLLEDLASDRDILLEMQKGLDDVAAKAEPIAAERLQKREAQPEDVPEVDKDPTDEDDYSDNLDD